jgi:hypothetical protein
MLKIILSYNFFFSPQRAQRTQRFFHHKGHKGTQRKKISFVPLSAPLCPWWFKKKFPSCTLWFKKKFPSWFKKKEIICFWNRPSILYNPL